MGERRDGYPVNAATVEFLAGERVALRAQLAAVTAALHERSCERDVAQAQFAECEGLFAAVTAERDELVRTNDMVSATFTRLLGATDTAIARAEASEEALISAHMARRYAEEACDAATEALRVERERAEKAEGTLRRILDIGEPMSAAIAQDAIAPVRIEP